MLVDSKFKMANVYNEYVKPNVQQFAGVLQNRRSYISQHLQKRTCAEGSFLITIVADLQLQSIFLKKETPALVFS